MGRKMLYPEKREAAFAAGTLARIQAVLTDTENQAGFIRRAVELELDRCENVPDARGAQVALETQAEGRVVGLDQHGRKVR